MFLIIYLCNIDVWLGSSLSELHFYLNSGYAKMYSETLCIQLVGIKERKTVLKYLIKLTLKLIYVKL